MGLTVLRAANHRRMPWKNGGGVTVEIAVHPEGASVDNFDWRISMATVASDGPFSVFPGIDRSLSVLEGDGIVLDVEGQKCTLTRASAPLAFAADARSGAVLIGSPITDLNVMTRRGRFAHSVERLTEETAFAATAGTTTLIFCAEGEFALKTAAGIAHLGAHDCAILPDDVTNSVELKGKGTAFLITITEV